MRIFLSLFLATLHSHLLQAGTAHVSLNTLALIAISQRKITRIVGMPEHVTWHLDPYGTLFVVTPQTFSFFLFDEYNTAYPLTLSPSLQGSTKTSLSKKEPYVEEHEILSFLHSEKAQAFQTTICNKKTNPCLASKACFTPQGYITIAPDITLKRNECTLGYIAPRTVLKKGKNKKRPGSLVTRKDYQALSCGQFYFI